jgi:DNA-directed RNA polymerase subunit beta'
MDQIGLPEEMLWKTFQPHIIRSMVQKGYKAVDAQRMIEERHPVARDTLIVETKRRPVLVNRAPTLHRYGIVGAYAVPVPGKTIRVNPFIENGMNLDYDGDTLQIHVPVSDKAVNEVKGTTMSNLLFGDRTKSELMVMPQHEAVLGIYAASAAKGGKTHRFTSEKEALKAYRRGEIELNDSVRIG